jgi:Lipase (class 3)
MARAPGTSEHRTYYAQFAHAAYQTPAAMSVPDGWTRDEGLSNRNRHVFVNDLDRKAVIAYKGTNPKNHGDLGTDLLLALNMRDFSARFRNAVRTVKQTRQKYADYEITAVGHSLGGSQASYVHNKLKDNNFKAVTFAAHTPTSDIQREAINSLIGDRQKRRNITNYAIGYDPVSTGTFLAGNSHSVKQTAKSPHAMANYLAE